MNIDQRALLFACGQQHLVGVIDVPERPVGRGVVLLADAGHYRIGAQRHGTLLSRSLASRGIPVLRFDRRGSGDADGEPASLDDAAIDIGAAVKESFMQLPEMKELVIWAFGEAATPALLHAHEAHVCGVVLLNPRLPPDDGAGLSQRVAASLACFGGHVLIMTGGEDEGTAAFLQLLERYRLACDRIDLTPARWRDEAAAAGANWLLSW